MPVNLRIAFNLACVAIIAAALVILFILMEREWVKEDLATRSAFPLSIRWSFTGPSLWERWGRPYGTYFRVRYRDIFGYIHHAWCYIPRTSWRKVKWLRDEIIGREIIP